MHFLANIKNITAAISPCFPLVGFFVRAPLRGKTVAASFSRREEEVLRLIAQGYSNKAIATAQGWLQNSS